MKKPKVYIASPYRLGDKQFNVERQIAVFDILLTAGFVPFAPLLNHFVDIQFPHTEDEWLEYDFEWQDCCDCVLRLDGMSAGADAEVARHNANGKPVFYSLIDLYRAYNKPLDIDKIK
jgi:hypothetical protein